MVGLGWRYLGLWKNRFFGRWAILGCSQPLGRLIFWISDTCIRGQKIFKKCGMKKIFWKIFRKTSKLSRNIFWACWDHIVAQKSLASKKKCQKLPNTGTPPHFTKLRDIARRALRALVFTLYTLHTGASRPCNTRYTRVWVTLGGGKIEPCYMIWRTLCVDF